MRLALLGALIVSVLAVEVGTAAPPPGLTERGRALWNFEALLRDTFGNRPVCRSQPNNFTAGSCAPLARFQPYSYVFRQARLSPFRITSRNVQSMDFGNHPVPVMIRGRGIVCDRSATRFLIAYSSSATFTVACLKPF